MALVALCIVHRFEPAWSKVAIGEAAGQHSLSAERVSRLASRAIALFEAGLGTLTRRGRPPQPVEQHSIVAELTSTLALLELATAILAVAVVPRSKVRELVVGAYGRLKDQYGVTQKRFCETLSLSERTLRSWLQPKATARPDSGGSGKDAAQQPRKRKRPLRRGRFNFDVTLPQTQVAADTTDIRAFGVDLKLVAAQDVGGRDASLLEQFVVQDADTAEHVVEVLSAALTRLPGAQAITDQATPYMAQLTREALDKMQVEHAPQKEGDPLGKSTVERAFLTIKSIAAPLLELSNRIADKMPSLCNTALAKSTVSLITAALLRAYQAGSRAAQRANQQREGVTPEDLARLAEDSRQKAIARDRSNRQLLRHIHELYDIQKPLRNFVESLRKYPTAVLRDAERAFAAQVHRDDIRDRASYFAALVRKLHDDYMRDKHRQQLERKQQEELERQQATWDCQVRTWKSSPAEWLRDSLEMIACQWQANEGKLLFDGVGAGLGNLQAAFARLVALHGQVAGLDVAFGVMLAFESSNTNLRGADATLAVRDLFDREVARRTVGETVCTPRQPGATLASLGRNQRPLPSVCLRN